MAQLFAFHFAEEVPTVAVNGAYDAEQQLWVGQSQPTATLATTTGTTSYSNSATPGDSDPDRVFDSDIDTYN